MPHSFSITDIATENAAHLGISPLPGRSGALETDLRTIIEWAPDLVISLTEQSEMDAMDAGNLGSLLTEHKISWAHMPIVDFGTPEDSDRIRWSELGERIGSILDAGGRVLVHCKGGRGRSGMIVLRMMIERGESPDNALKRLRAVRAGAVETDEQFAWATGTASRDPVAPGSVTSQEQAAGLIEADRERK